MTIGNQLKRARQRKEVTLTEVYQQTRIHPNVLDTLEQDNFDNILNVAYTRSFLREYASYLGLDAKKILAQYDKLHRKDQQQITETYGIAETKFSLPKMDTDKILRIGKRVVLSVALIVLLISFIKTLGWVKVSIAERRAMRTSQAESAGLKEKQETATRGELSRRPPKSSAEAKKSLVSAGEKLRLTISVTDDVWIQLKSDGRVVSQSVLKKGSSETWESDKSLEIWTGNAAAMQLDLNGNNLGSPGRGVMRGIVVTREGISK